MTQRERYPHNDPREWMNRARSDLAIARADIPEAYPEDLCFHAQQAAEKAIKGILTMHNRTFPFVHNLGILARLLEEAGEEIPEEARLADRLTDYARIFRYPSEFPMATEQDLAEAVSIAEAVVRWAEGRVPAGGRQGAK